MTTAIRLECSYCFRRYLFDTPPAGASFDCLRCGHPIAVPGGENSGGARITSSRPDLVAQAVSGKRSRRLQTRAGKKSDRHAAVSSESGSASDSGESAAIGATETDAEAESKLVVSDVNIAAFQVHRPVEAAPPDAVPVDAGTTVADSPAEEAAASASDTKPSGRLHIHGKRRRDDDDSSESGSDSTSERQRESLVEMVGAAAAPAEIAGDLGLSVPPAVRRLVNLWKDGQIEASELFDSIHDKAVGRLVLGEIKKLAADKHIDLRVFEREFAAETDIASNAAPPTETPAESPATREIGEPPGMLDVSSISTSGIELLPSALAVSAGDLGSASETAAFDADEFVADEFEAEIGDMEMAPFGAFDPAFADEAAAEDVSLTRRFSWEENSVEVRRDDSAWEDDSADDHTPLVGSVSDARMPAVVGDDSPLVPVDEFGGLEEARFDHLEASPLVPLSDDAFGDLAPAAFASVSGRRPAFGGESGIGGGREEATEIDIFFDPNLGDNEPQMIVVDPDQELAKELVAAAAFDAEFNPFLGDFSESSRRPVIRPDASGRVQVIVPAEAVPIKPEPPKPPTSRSSRMLPAERVKATAPAARLRRKAPLPPGKRMHLAGMNLDTVADIEPPPDLRLDIEMAAPLPSEPTPGTVITIGDATYTVMAPDEALLRLLRTGDLPEGTYVHSLDFGYFPDSWDNPTSWHLRGPLASRMYAREEDFYIPRGGPTASDCLPVTWPRRPIKIHRCCFGTLNMSRASFPAGFALTESRILSRTTAVRARFDGWVDFARTVFPHVCAFFQSRATGPVTFRRCYFQGVAYFAELRFDGFTSFRQVDVAGDLDLSGSRFTDDLDLREVVVLGSGLCGQLQVHGNADFTDSGFHGDIDLQLASVRGNARFNGMACGSEFQAERCRLLGPADFSNARFAGPAHLAHSRFGSDATFGKTRFGSIADMYHIEVAGSLDVTEAIFHGDAVFATSRFQGMVRLNVDPISRIRVEQTQKAADFRGSLRFDHAVFQKPLLANGVRFRQRTTFRRCTWEESATFAEAFFETGFDLSEAFVGKELDFRSATVGGRLNLNGVHVGGRAMLFGARFRAISLTEATVGVLALDKQQLYPDTFDLRENRHDPEVPPFRPYETRYPVKLYHYRHATMGSDPALPGSRPQLLSRDKRIAAKRARLIGGMDAELKLEEGGARLVAFDRAREEFILLEKSFRELGRQSPSEWAYLMARRMSRSARVIGGRGVKPVDEALLIVEKEITALDELRRMIDSEDVLNPKYPAELRIRREILLAGKGGPRESWTRLKDLTLQAIRARITPLQEKRRRILDRLKPLEMPRPRTEWEHYQIPLAWHSRTAFEGMLDVSSGYGTQPWRLAIIALLVVVGFALFYTRMSYHEELRLPKQPTQAAAMRAIVFEKPLAHSAMMTEPAAAGSPSTTNAPIPVWPPSPVADYATPPASADPIAGKSAPARLHDYTVFSAKAFTGQGFGDTHPRADHWMVYVVLLETILGLATIIFFVITLVRKALR